MFVAAYLVARWLWVPLAACWLAAGRSSGRGALLPAMIVSALAAVWEAAIPASANIRIDLLVVVPVLVFSELLSVGLLVSTIRSRRKAGQPISPVLLAAALICAAGPVYLVLAWAVSSRRSEQQYQEYVDGSRYWFEAAFSDDDAQRIAFGELDGTRWAGYYIAEPPDPLHQHLVVSRSGAFFLFGPTFRTERGRAEPHTGDETVLKGPLIRYNVKSGEALLRDVGQGRLAARITDLGAPRDVAFSKRPPPRFARPPEAGGKVRYRGVFSARADDERYVFVSQLWLWESDGQVWGKLLRQAFPRGQETEAVGQRDAEVKCVDAACGSIAIKTQDDAAFTLRWDGGDRLVQERGYQGRDLVFERGEIVPGFLYDRAPLAKPEENRRWLRSIQPVVAWAPK
jgi:hypothetical protein